MPKNKHTVMFLLHFILLQAD